MTLKTHRLRTVEQVRAFLDGSGELDVKSVERAAAYDFITETLNRLGYARLCHRHRHPRPGAPSRRHRQHGRNAKLLFGARLVLDASSAGLYLHPKHRRRRSSPPICLAKNDALSRNMCHRSCLQSSNYDGYWARSQDARQDV